MKKKRKHKRYRIHYGRLIVALIILILIIGAVVFIVTSCNKDTYRSESGFDDYAAKYFETITGPKEYGEMQEYTENAKREAKGRSSLWPCSSRVLIMKPSTIL